MTSATLDLYRQFRRDGYRATDAFRMAHHLDAAERMDIVFVWEDDPEGDHSYLDDWPEPERARAERDLTCEQCLAYGPAPVNTSIYYRNMDDERELLASIGCIDNADTRYRRAIEAELAAEALGVLAGRQELADRLTAELATN